MKSLISINWLFCSGSAILYEGAIYNDNCTFLCLVFVRYLPPYIIFLPIRGSNELREEALETDKRMKNPKKNKKNMMVVIETMLLSQLSYLVMFVIVICITERKSLKDDPLNFNVLNIVFEVIRYIYCFLICHVHYLGLV